MSDPILRVMPREMRLMSERIWSLSALPKGFALMLGDVVMYSQAMGLGGFAQMLARCDALLSADPTRLSLRETAGRGMCLDGGGQHAWIAVPSLLDLLQEQLASRTTAEIEVVNLLAPEEIAIAAGLAHRAGMALEMSGARIRATAANPADPVLERVMDEGCAIPADLWWQVWAKAQTALTPDSVVSRRHAGVNIVTDDGQIIGRTDNDDDTDASFIAAPMAAKQTEGLGP